uniref:Holin n=1 Tax=Pseudomonas phage RVTF4 TaxID=3236931 RepID=A0AB39CCD7_9VIRU
MIPFYWQGSVIGSILGCIIILVAGWFFVRAKLDFVSKKARFWISSAILALWMASFINVGHTQNSLGRQSFDSVGKMGLENVERVSKPGLTPADVRQKAEETSREIRANAQ